MSITDSVSDPPRTAGPPGVPERSGLVLAFLCIAGFMTFLDVSIVNVALPSIERSLSIDESQLQYIVTAYGTVLGGFLLLGGRIADRWGRRRALQTGLLLFAGASLLAGVSVTTPMLIVARALQGLGSAFIAPAALSLLTNTFTAGPARARALGVWGGVSGIASVIGVVLGGLLADGPGWRWIFFINVPIGVAAALLAPAIVPESRLERRRETFDIAGAVVLTVGLLLLIYTLGQTIDAGWLSARIIGGLAVAAVLLVGFVMIERRTKAPLIPLSIFRLPVLRTANITAVLMMATLVTLFFFASLFMQQVLGYSPVRTGLAYVPLALVVSVGAGISTKLVTKVAAKRVLITGLLMSTAGLLLLARLPVHGSYLVDLLPPFLIIGIGMGLAFVPLQIAAFADVDEPHSGLAAGLINTSQEGGGALGVAVAATIAFSRIPELTAWANGDPARILQGRAIVFHEAFVVGACFALAAVAMSLLLPAMRASERPDAVPVG
ncbi:MAG TPA: MFS transporter [Mycobacteriales bacterium]|nr:MFS transporter [Mycobacteriales bacterium]